MSNIFSQYGEVARIVQLNHAANSWFPVYSGRRLVIFRKLNVPIPQHLEMGGIKLRASYSSQVKICGICGDNHLRHLCPQASGEHSRKDINQPRYEHGEVMSVFPVNVNSRKRMLSNGLEDHSALPDTEDQDIVPDTQLATETQNVNQTMELDTVSDVILSDQQNNSTTAEVPTNSGTISSVDVSSEPISSLSLSSTKQDYNKDFPIFPTTGSPDQNITPTVQQFRTQTPVTTAVTSEVKPPVPPESPSFTARASAMMSSLLSTRVLQSDTTASLTPSVQSTSTGKKNEIRRSAIGTAFH